MRRWVVAVVLGIGIAGALPPASVVASGGTPRWRFDYGDAWRAGVLNPDLPNASAIGLGSDGRVQVAESATIEEMTAVGEHSRTLSVATPVAMTSDGTRDFVARAGANGVQVYAAHDAAPIATWDAGATVTALAFSHDPYWAKDVLWVADSAGTRIRGFDPSGQLVTSFGSRAAHVTGLTALPDGTVLVLDGPDGFVQRLTPQGVPVGRFGSAGSGDGQLSGAQGITADSAGTVFVADTANARVEMFDGVGHYQGQFGTHVDIQPGAAAVYGPGEFSSPRGVVVDCVGRLHVLDVTPAPSVGQTPEGRVAVYTGVAAPTGTCPGPATTGFTAAENAVVAVDRAGDYYVAAGAKVSKYDAKGHLITAWTSPASGPGHWADANGITVSPQGEVYLADGGNAGTRRVLEFHAAGTFVRSWPSDAGFAPGNIVVRPSDRHVFVNYFAHGVEEFTSAGAAVGLLKMAPIDGQDVIQTWALGLQGNTLLVATQQWDNPGEVMVQRFDAHDSYLDQVRGPYRANVGDDYAVGVAPYPGGGYVVAGVPTDGEFSADETASGLVRLAADGTVLGRLAEKAVSPDGAVAFGLAVDCAGRIIGTNVVTGEVFRLQASSTVCRWLPTATTGPVTSSTRSGLVVRATVDPSAQVTRVRVQYGATSAYGHATSWITLPSDNVALVRSITLAGLAPAHRYHYRVQVSNASGTVVGRDATGATR